MMCSRVVFNRILDELEPGESDRVVGQMIRPGRIANRQRRHAEVLERFHPGGKYRRHRFVSLQVHAADRARPVVHVEVAGKLRMVRLQLHRCWIAEVILHVRSRSEQSFFLCAP